MADTLSALNIPKATAFLSGADAPVTPKGYIGMREVAPIQEELTNAVSQAEKDVGMADIQVERAKREETTRDLESQAKFAQEEAAKLRDLPERQAMKKKREEFGNFKFVPTKENADDLATLFSLVSVIGMAIGGGGKQNAQQAMSAMNGMLEGHQKGRADLYKQQQIEFDKNFKAMQAAVQSAEKEYEEAVRMNMVDKEAGEIARKMALAKLHSPMLKAMEDRLGPLAVLNTLKELKTSSVKNATDLVNNLQDKADTRQDAKDRQRQTMEQAELLARIRAGSTTGTGLKPGAKVTEAYVADNQLKTDIQDILKDLKTNPSLVNDLKKYRVEAFLTEEGKVLNQLVSGDIPPNLRQFLTKVRDVRNNYYLNISGKAVTGGEALRSYGTVPQPGDNAAQMIDKLSGMSNRVSQAISIKQQLYGLPSLNLNAGGATSLVPNEDYSRDTEGGAAGSGSVARPKTDAEFNALPRGTRYIDPDDGKEYRKK